MDINQKITIQVFEKEEKHYLTHYVTDDSLVDALANDGWVCIDEEHTSLHDLLVELITAAGDSEALDYTYIDGVQTDDLIAQLGLESLYEYGIW